MPFNYNAAGIAILGIPEDEYILQIKNAKEGKSKGGDYQVTCSLEVVGGKHNGVSVTHYVTFLPKGHKSAGMALHFLHSRGQPFEGEFNVDPQQWLNNYVSAYLVRDEFNGKVSMKIKWCKAADPEKLKAALESQIPF